MPCGTLDWIWEQKKGIRGKSGEMQMKSGVRSKIMSNGGLLV